MNLGEKIEQLLKTTAMTKVELSRKLGLKDSSVVSHWVKNRFKPDRDNVAKLSMVFEKPISYFADDAGYTYTRNIGEDNNLEQKLYDVLSSLPQAGHIGVRADVSEEYFSFPYYLQPEEFLPIMLEGGAPNLAPYALKISDDKACPWAKAGEYALIVPSQEVLFGKINLVKIEGLCALKKVSKNKTKNMITLEGKGKTSCKHKRQDIEILGHVLAFYRKS